MRGLRSTLALVIVLAGLGAYVYFVTWKKGDKDYQRLFIGEKNPTGIDIFAKRNDEKRVFVIPAYVESAFNVSTFDLRDKTVLKFDHDKVDGIELTAEGKTFELGKDGSDWK